MKYSSLIQSVQLRPLLVRPQQAALLLGSGELLADFVGAGWLRPVISEHRLVIYSYRELEACVARLEAGESLDPDGDSVRPKPPALPVEDPQLPADILSFTEQLRRVVSIRPLLVRPEQAAALVGSEELVDEFRKEGWLRPVVSKPRLTLYSVRQLEGCVTRLEAGRKLGVYARVEQPPKPCSKLPQIAAVNNPQQRTFRKTRRPMPPQAKAVAA